MSVSCRVVCAIAVTGMLGVSGEINGQDQAPAAAAPVDNSPVGIASREATRRLDTVKAAQDLLTAAEFDRSENRNKEALEKLGTAFQAVSNVPAARETRQAIFSRYQKAALAYANELVDQARWEEAQTVLTNAMSTARDAGKLPAQVDPGIRKLMAQLKGNHFNKAMSPKHLDTVTLVERSLKEAEVLIGAGDFDGARKLFHLTLNLDPYNRAARRGLEKLEQLEMEYQRVAYNQTRATKMREVAEGWNTQPPPSILPSEGVDDLITAGTGQAALREKLRRIVIPQIEFQETPMRSVIEFLTQKAQELDSGTTDPAKRGLNIVVDTAGGAPIDDQPVTIRLANAPLGNVLDYVTQQVGMRYRIDEFAISIVPLTSSDESQLITWVFEVPPGFITGDAGGGGGGGAPDPFAPQPAAGGGTLVKRISAQEFLEQRGVSFPPGSVAQLTGTSRMVVRNTADNVELIDALIQASKETGTKMVMVEFKMISIAEDTLKELGFDTLLGAFNAGGGQSVFASGGTFGNQPGRVIEDFPFGATGSNPVTGGIRSGDTRVTQSIDDIINRNSPEEAATTGAAPGVFAVAGVFTDPQFQTVWRALSQQKGTDNLCTASVLTRPGERAVIRQVREFIYPTEYDPPEIPNSIGIATIGLAGGGTDATIPVVPSTPAAFEMRELGKIIEFEPVIAADGFTVDLNLSSDITDFVGFVNYGSPITQNQPSSAPGGGVFGTGGEPITITVNRILMPVFDAVKNTTNVTVYDGSTIVIGGLLGEQIDTVQDKVPLLGDFPVIGTFFRNSIQERKKRALLLFATVRILDSSGQPFNDLRQFTRGVTAQAN